MTIQQPIIATDGRNSNWEREDESDTTRRTEEDRDIRDSSPRLTAQAETPYLPGQTSVEAGDRWKRVQAEFVDDPRKSVSQAHELVSELMQRIVDAFSHERDNLEQQWSKGDSVSTEDLRVCLQRYRAFFSRLLPSAKGLDDAS